MEKIQDKHKIMSDKQHVLYQKIIKDEISQSASRLLKIENLYGVLVWWMGGGECWNLSNLTFIQFKYIEFVKIPLIPWILKSHNNSTQSESSHYYFYRFLFSLQPLKMESPFKLEDMVESRTLCQHCNKISFKRNITDLN